MIQAIKKTDPIIPTDKLMPKLEANKLSSLDSIVRDLGIEIFSINQIESLTYQRLLFKLIDSNQRIEHLENERLKLLNEIQQNKSKRFF